jgi:hypothetical protein
MKIKIIGIYQLITGIFGMLLILLSIAKAIENKEIRFIVFLGLVLFFGLAFCGYALLKDFKNAVKYSIVAQIVQIFSIVFNGSVYLFTGSAFISLVIKSTCININYQMLPIAYKVSTATDFYPFELKIFLVPLLFTILLTFKRIDF